MSGVRYRDPEMAMRAESHQYRLKLVLVPRREMLHVIRTRGERWPECIRVPVFRDLPADVEIIQHGVDEERVCFYFVVAHPSFDVVPLGERPPCVLCEVFDVLILPKETLEDKHYHYDLVGALQKENTLLHNVFADLRDEKKISGGSRDIALAAVTTLLQTHYNDCAARGASTRDLDFIASCVMIVQRYAGLDLAKGEETMKVAKYFDPEASDD